MDSIRVKNFRSIVDSNDIQLNSINILLGENSSGKSSFVRLFPMFKESTQHELRGPLLWFDEYYDFGSFTNIISRNAEDNIVSFNFKWKLNPSKKDDLLHLSDSEDLSNTFKDCETELRISDENGITVLKDISIKFNYKISRKSPYIISIQDDNGQLRVVVDSHLVQTSDLNWDYNTKRIVPRIHGFRKIYNKIREFQKELSYDENNLLYDAITGVFGFKKKDITKALLKYYPNSINKLEESEIDDIKETLLLLRVSDIIEYVSKFLSSYFKNVYYITPLRYNFTRYMRYKDLAVDFIAPNGRNVMEYIATLSELDINLYNDFINKTLGISVRIKGDENKGIYIYDSNECEDNIVDVGYGLSQVLPIATMLWDRAHKTFAESTLSTIVIEQPEVHLHPHMQAKLAKLFIEAINIAKQNGNKLCLVIETHSNVLVNQFGKYVYYNQHKPDLNKDNITISNNDISIYLFEKERGVTKIISTGYNEQGRILQWPIGFLD